ncbi:MAG: hypothetical protein MJ236_03715 [Clostridia bacterium]|nr:hypothetical protein [Clostridia bacterium]
MINANFSQMMKAKLLPWSSEYKMKSIAGNVNTATEDPYVEYLMGNFVFHDILNIKHNDELTLNRFFIMFGNGNDAMKFSDHKLTNIVDDITISNISFNYNPNYNAGTSIGFYTVVVTNQTDAPVELKEIGLFTTTGNSEPWSDDRVYMLSRDIFPTVTVQPGEYYTFTIALS